MPFRVHDEQSMKALKMHLENADSKPGRSDQHHEKGSDSDKANKVPRPHSEVHEQKPSTPAVVFTGRSITKQKLSLEQRQQPRVLNISEELLYRSDQPNPSRPFAMKTRPQSASANLT